MEYFTNIMENKICVYTVCKDESKFVDRWVDSMSEADCIVAIVHDTKDDTAEKLIARGVKVCFTHYPQWRFDTSKNDALKWAKECAPDCNIFAFVSLDEVFDKGWADILIDNWRPEHEICFYKFVQSHDENGQDALVTGFNWIHNRDDAWYWKYPVDEVIARDDKPVSELIYCNLFDKLTLHHWPDYSKPRDYVTLHRLRYDDFPDDTSILCLCRDFHWMKAHDELDNLLKDKDIDKLNLNNEEKAFIVMCVADKERDKGNFLEAVKNYRKALEYDSAFRDIYMQYGIMLCDNQMFPEAEKILKDGLKNSWRSYSYLEDPSCWTSTYYIYLTVATYYQDKFAEALAYSIIALEKNKYDELAKTNYELCLNRMKEIYP